MLQGRGQEIPPTVKAKLEEGLGQTSEAATGTLSVEVFNVPGGDSPLLDLAVAQTLYRTCCFCANQRGGAAAEENRALSRGPWASHCWCWVCLALQPVSSPGCG